MNFENSDVFYRVLDQELPRSIAAAKELLIEDFWGPGEANASDEAALEWPAVQSFNESIRSGFVSEEEHLEECIGIQVLVEFRDRLGCLATAYEVFGFAPFASKADAALGEIQSKGLKCFGDSNYYASGRFAEKLGDSYHFDRLSVVEVILSVARLEKSNRIGANRLRSFRRLIEYRLDRAQRLAARMEASENIRESLAWALHCVVYSIYLDDKDALERVASICEESILREANSRARALFETGSENGSVKAVAEWLEVYLALAHWLASERDGERFDDPHIKMVVEHSLPLWGDACNLQGDALSPELISLFTKPSMVLLLGIVSGEVNFVQLWEDLSLVGNIEISSSQNVMTFPLLWLQSSDSGEYSYSIESEFSFLIKRGSYR